MTEMGGMKKDVKMVRESGCVGMVGNKDGSWGWG
jgi:hypothetical protein